VFALSIPSSVADDLLPMALLVAVLYTSAISPPTTK